MEKYSYLRGVNAEYIDLVYQNYLKDPNSVEESWRFFFEGIEFGAEQAGSVAHLSLYAPQIENHKATDDEVKVAKLIQAYRESGLLSANINPLSDRPTEHSFLSLKRFGLSESDLDKVFTAGHLLGLGQTSLRNILNFLKETYCSSIGVEFIHIQNPEERDWLQNKMEATRNKSSLSAEDKKYIYKRLSQSETFERFLHTRYVAQKRFSIEGGESAIPALDCMIETGAELGAQEFVVGMAHRGRLNVLTHIFGKKTEYMLVEFEGTYKNDPSAGEGDVKYHKGYSSDLVTRKGKNVHLSLAFNPSHLEFVNAVVVGSARAKQSLLKDESRTQVVPILIHGDAAFAGQGVCYEVLGLSQLEGYRTGGTLHLIINNQVGFTTNHTDSRSTPFATDMALMLQSPIFHVNGDDPEAVWHASKLAIEYRTKFHKDVFIDLICYRKHGHNEGDEPTFTQPLMYKKIKAKESTRELYAQQLASSGVQSSEENQKVIEDLISHYTEAQTRVRAEPPTPKNSVFEGSQWKGLKQPTSEELFKEIKTQVSSSTLKTLSQTLNTIPSSFHLHPKLSRFFEARLKAVTEGKGIDWGNAETLAYASLVIEGHPVRITGQDAERGTFTHRHAVLNDTETAQKYTPLNQLSNSQARFSVYNSSLSETGVLGFEYGYSLSAPQTLTIWEAQFGDFANGAQVVIDQFIATSESKWQRMSGLSLLLPHGYEGQGPEHSSARLERFLQLAGRNNMFICNLTTPAQIFHALRRQVKLNYRKPLVVMSPKSLLRNPLAVSNLEDLSESNFQEVIGDQSVSPQNVKRVLICSGKVYYDLVNKRTELSRQDIAIVRLEQLYPFAESKMAAVLNQYPNAELIWVQEEPRNMGAWNFVFNFWMGGLSDFRKQVGNREIRYVGRDWAASPAVGSPKVHEQETKSFLELAFKGN